MKQASSRSSAKPPAYDNDFGRRLQSREKHIVRLMEETLVRRDAVSKLRQNQSHEFRSHLAKLKACGWREAMALQRDPDNTLRPPDRQHAVRLYSNMDRDLWYMDPLRAWFNKHEGSAKPWEGMDPVKSGYVVNNTDPPVEKLHSLASEVPRPSPSAASSSYDFRHRSPYHVSTNQPAGSRHVRGEVGAHWLDHEGQVRQQRQVSERKLEERRFYPEPFDGHMPGCRRAPWRERPAAEEDVNRGSIRTPHGIMARETALLQGMGLHLHQELRQEARQRKLDFQRGSLADGL